MIKVKENDGMRSIPVKDETPRSLTAAKDGVITRMVVRSGKAQAEPGDTVQQGQLLVSGVVPIYNDAQELVNEQYVLSLIHILYRHRACVMQDESAII